jgi:hypothetical protein
MIPMTLLRKIKQYKLVGPFVNRSSKFSDFPMCTYKLGLGPGSGSGPGSASKWKFGSGSTPLEKRFGGIMPLFLTFI